MARLAPSSDRAQESISLSFSPRTISFPGLRAGSEAKGRIFIFRWKVPISYVPNVPRVIAPPRTKAIFPFQRKLHTGKVHTHIHTHTHTHAGDDRDTDRAGAEGNDFPRHFHRQDSQRGSRLRKLPDDFSRGGYRAVTQHSACGAAADSQRLKCVDDSRVPFSVENDRVHARRVIPGVCMRKWKNTRTRPMNKSCKDVASKD